MAITVTTAMPNSFKVELLKGVHNFTASTGDTFKLALFKASGAGSGTYGSSTTSYNEMVANSDEVANGNGYTTGGATLTSVTPILDGSVAVCDFADVSLTGATFTSCGGIIYNSTASGNPACAVLSFGGDYAVSAGTFQVVFPLPYAASAIIKIS